jgi:hypothetical protein
MLSYLLQHFIKPIIITLFLRFSTQFYSTPLIHTTTNTIVKYKPKRKNKIVNEIFFVTT